MTTITEEKVFDTMATDGKRMYFNPEWTKKLTDSELITVMLHELLHIVYFHCDKNRLGSRDHRIWGYAADYAINYEIHEMNYDFPKCPECKGRGRAHCKVCEGTGICGLYDEKYKGMTTEQIYDMLCKDKVFMSMMGGGGDGSDGVIRIDGHIITQSDWDEIRDKIIAAAESTKGQGNISAGVQQMIDKLRKSKVPWQRMFHRYVGSALAKDDYSFSRPNRRYLGHDLYMPDLRNAIIGHVVVGLDTSGSVGAEDREQFASELAKIGSLVSEVTVFTCDAEVHEVVKLTQFENFLKKIKFEGGGGTDFNPVFDKIAELRMQPELAVYLTDTMGSFPEKAPRYPVLWVSNNIDGKVPWGQIVYM
jgi:predicted metal-dependent peptidase